MRTETYSHDTADFAALGLFAIGLENPGPDYPDLDDPDTEVRDADAFQNALSIVAHDLKGPLANLSLIVEDISRNAPDGSRERIERNADKADMIIGQLSKMLSALLVRARDGRDPLSCERAPVNLVEVLELAFAVNQPYARQKSIRFRCHAFDDVTVQGDQELLFEAFDNLIGNAVKHTREGGTITCETGPAEDGRIYVSIYDEGPGFRASDLLRAFRPFTRLSAKAKNGERSNGLGLWITRLIAERHGGQIEARNRQDNAGAELTLRLPATGKLGASRPSSADR
ncbi:HAMP domain-containing sensor histidine kinase [uncultured Roseibium sp.]|uniref:sensor histidine kinase n=1 Tax=uncultured Roseibium sp. TaxID=1936171 RepID=UPI00321672D8